MQVTHLVSYNPHQCGLYESALELIEEENKQGLNARFLDTNGKFHPYLEDRGVSSCDIEFLEKSDIVVMHSMLDKKLLDAVRKPIVLILHGTPRDCMWGEIFQGTNSYSLCVGFRHDPRFSFVTMWPRHTEFWNCVLPRVDLINAPVNTERFNPEIEPYQFTGKSFGRPNVLFADTWRIDKNPFEMMHAFKYFKEWFPEARIHIYCRENTKAWENFFSAITGMDDSYLGEYAGMTTKFPNIVKACDFLITPQRDGTRTIRECLAIGKPVVAAEGNTHTPYTADFYYPKQFAIAMKRCWTELQKIPDVVSNECLDRVAKDFSVKKSVSDLISIFERELKCIRF